LRKKPRFWLSRAPGKSSPNVLFDEFFSRIEAHQRRYPGEVPVAMEGYNGFARPLDTLVQQHHWHLFNVNNLGNRRGQVCFLLFQQP